jgi:hypothetical protein
MKAKTQLALLAGLTMALHAPAASGQYITRPRSYEVGVQGAGQAAAGNPAGLGMAFVTFISGDALFRSTDAEEWDALTPNLSLRIGDRIWAQDDARVEVRFPLGASAWVNYQSELDVTRMERGGRVDTIQLALVSGEAAFDTRGFARPGSVLQVDIPNASIRAYHAARFRVNTLPDGTAQIGVIGGTIALETRDGLTDVSGGQMAELQPDGRVVLDFLPASDPWDDWVRSRAEIYDRPAASARYLPSDLSAYAHEFDTSGRWASDPTYGWVWVPAVAQGWSPYSNGRWIWQAGDYVWLGFDPWYAPFHYGRWSWAVGLGWFWIAPRGGSYWAPGYVAWSVGGDEVSWVPLGYNEVYYGYGYYGPRSVNVNRTTVVNVTNVYVNSRVNNGVVVVKKESFLSGRVAHGRITPAGNPFQGGGAGGVHVIGRPPVLEVKPVHETRRSRPEEEIKHLPHPPAQLEKTSVTIKDRFVAPTKETSAFKSGNKPVPLKNVVKEKEFEQWVPPKTTPTVKSGGAPPAAESVKKTEVHGKPATSSPAAWTEVPQPAGKHQFKRVLEPQAGTGAVPPAPKFVPKEMPKGEKVKEPPADARKKGSEHGAGDEK